MSSVKTWAARRPSSPSRAWARNSSASVRPASTLKAGNIGFFGVAMKAQRRAMTSVLSTASGKSANSARISPGDLKRCSGVSRRRFGSDTWAPSAMAEQRIVRLVHAFVGEEHVVGGDQRQIDLVGEIEQARFDARLLLQAVALQLDIEPPGKRFAQRLQAFPRGIVLAGEQQAADRAFGAAGQHDQAFAAGGQIGQRDLRRLAGHAVEISVAEQAREIAVAGFGLHQHDHLVRRRGARIGAEAGLQIAAVLAPDRQLAADDRLHAGIGQGHGEFVGAEQVAAVGHGRGRHGVFAAQLGELADLQRPFEQRIGGMDAEMDEIGVGHGNGTCLRAKE